MMLKSRKFSKVHQQSVDNRLIQYHSNSLVLSGVVGLSRKIIKSSPDVDESVRYSARKELIHSLEIYDTYVELGMISAIQ